MSAPGQVRSFCMRSLLKIFMVRRSWTWESYLYLESIVCKVHTLGQALLNLCMQANVVHHMGEIGLARFKVVNNS